MDRGLPIPPETMMSDPSAPLHLPYRPTRYPPRTGMFFGGFPGRYICQNP